MCIPIVVGKSCKGEGDDPTFRHVFKFTLSLDVLYIKRWLLITALWSVLLLRGFPCLCCHQRLIFGWGMTLVSGALSLIKSSRSSSDWFVRRECLLTLIVRKVENTRSSFPFDAGREKRSSARTTTIHATVSATQIDYQGKRWQYIVLHTHQIPS